jgi:hypothetical protein
MQITFRYTNAEYKATKRLNKMLGMPKWKSYGLAMVCLLPSFLMIWIFSGSTIMLIAFAVLILVVAVLSLVAAIRENPYRDKYDHVLTLSDTSKYEKNSNSEFESDWRHFDEFSETDTSFIFRKLERYSVIPKRVVPAEHLGEFRRYAAKVNELLDESTPPVPLFDRLFLNDAQDTIYQFTYHPDDLANAITDPLKMVNEENLPAIKKGSRLGPVWLALFVMVLVYFILDSPNRIPGAGQWRLTQALILLGAIVLPFFLIRILNSWFRSRAKKQSNSVPREENQMRLTSSGWAIGSPRSALFYDWRDVDAFYENKFCIGFKTFNDLVQIIPKRIFADADAAQAFLKQAIGLRHEYRRSFEEPLVAVETGNPYQPPAI